MNKAFTMYLYTNTVAFIQLFRGWKRKLMPVIICSPSGGLLCPQVVMAATLAY